MNNKNVIKIRILIYNCISTSLCILPNFKIVGVYQSFAVYVRSRYIFWQIFL